ncbi:MAG TPA: TerC/Alx family metal homeostasis membrane protein [Galbitalea sp.]|nr:TerC/Alx family metal homeostasis membrane protein [Galbitalea sp.]
MIPRWLEIGSLAVMGVVIVADLLFAYRRPRIPSTRESAIWIGFYVVLALVFAGLVLVFSGPDSSGQFVAGWLTEYSLSIDNLFVFVIIMGRFSVPRTLQQSLLLLGIVLALLLRGVFILLGVTLINNFSWIFYLFGAFLLYTAVQQLLSNRKDTEETESKAIRFLRRHIPITQHYDGTALTIQRDGKRMLTPIIVVFLAIGTTDLLFALDSIPAIFGITQDAFIVFAANLFALMGLRQLYFLLGDLMNRLAYLSYGIAAILVFIGAKLVLHALHDNQVFFVNGGKSVEWAPEIDTLTSLAVIVLAMAVAVGASLIKLRVEAARESRASPGPP